jgi:ribA/ribD-fused uncharacterized protein
MARVEKKVIDRFDGTEYGYMSNFSPHPVNFRGEVYPTSEHAYQAMKTLDPKEQKKIQKAKTPYIAKRLGRSCTLRKDWESVKRDLMFDIVLLKFYQHPNLAKDLVLTGDVKLAEGNTWHDNFFGTCVCSRCGNKGKNQLGKILMEVRTIIADSYDFKKYPFGQ